MKQMTFDDMPRILQDYLKNYLIITKNRSKTTVKEYYYDLRDAFQFIKRDKYNIKVENFKEINITDLDANFFKSIEVSDIYEYLYDKNNFEEYIFDLSLSINKITADCKKNFYNWKEYKIYKK